NAAREPEGVDLCTMLVAMGADISGVGTSRLVVRGVERGSLRAVAYRRGPDRIKAATYLAAVAAAGGDLTIRDARAEHMENLLGRFADMGLELAAEPNVLHVAAEGRLGWSDVQP